MDNVIEFGYNLLQQHELFDWRIELRKKMEGKLGACYYKGKIIAISKYYAENNSRQNVVNTILHEIAHALTPGHKHDSIWLETAQKLGVQKTDINVVVEPGKYQSVCPTCGRIYHKYRKPKYQKGYYCPICGVKSQLKWS